MGSAYGLDEFLLCLATLDLKVVAQGRLYSAKSIYATVQCDRKRMQQIFKLKILSFFAVNLLEILHASSYGILVYIYKVKKPAAKWQP